MDANVQQLNANRMTSPVAIPCTSSLRTCSKMMSLQSSVSAAGEQNILESLLFSLQKLQRNYALPGCFGRCVRKRRNQFDALISISAGRTHTQNRKEDGFRLISYSTRAEHCRRRRHAHQADVIITLPLPGILLEVSTCR